MDFGSTRLTFGRGYQAFAKGGVGPNWNERAERGFLKPSWPLLATPSAVRHHRLIYQPLCSLRKLTGAALNGGHMTCRVISHNLCWRQRASGRKHQSILNRIELFCIGANLVQKWYGGRFWSVWRKIVVSVSLCLVVNLRTFQLLKDINVMIEMIEDWKIILTAFLQVHTV